MGKLVFRQKKTLWTATNYAWGNAGLIGDTTHTWFNNDNTFVVDGTNIPTTVWLGPIQTYGASRLFLQWSGLLGAQAGGGLDAVIASPAYVLAIGLPYYDPNVAVDSVPSLTRTQIAQTAVDEFGGQFLQVIGIGADASVGAAAVTGLTLSGAGASVRGVLFIPDGTDAASGDYTTAWCEVSNRKYVQVNAASGGVEPSVDGISAVWVAIKIIPDFTDSGDVSGILASGKWEALLYDEIPEVRQSQARVNTRRDKMIGNVPVAP